jgi:hypothetical protein
LFCIELIPPEQNLFFEYPLNNFLHNVVYDIIQQMLNGRITAGFNRELIIDLFNEAKLICRILDTEESAKEEGYVRRPCLHERTTETFFTAANGTSGQGTWVIYC